MLKRGQAGSKATNAELAALTTAIAAKADASATTTALGTKATSTALTEGLALKQNLTGNTFAVATLPAAAANIGRVIYVSDGNAGAPCAAISSGTQWLVIAVGAEAAIA